MTVALDDAYRACEEITRAEAGNFFYGIRLLPADKRRAMCAVYALARRIDDIGDGDLPPEEKRAQLDRARAGLDPDNFDRTDPVLVAAHDARRRFALPFDAFGDLIDGVEMDLAGAEYETFDDLVLYCRRVAGSIGRLCTAIFGADDRVKADRLADDLGVAMQLTNILRDVRELGRTYLPLEDLRRFGCGDDLLAAPPDAVSELVAFEASRARAWFDRGLRLLPMLDARSASCVSAMTGIYRRLLERIEARPLDVLERRTSLPAWEKAWVAARSLARPRASAGASR
jgi:phytoene synthase